MGINQFKFLIKCLKNEGIIWTYDLVKQRLTGRTMSRFLNFKRRFEYKDGLEIGGPSSLFNKWNLIPIYPIVNSLDNVLFSKYNVWNKEQSVDYIVDGEVKGKVNYLDVTEVSKLKKQYDFVLMSHVLEHVANPYKALFEVKKILKDRGTLLIIVPVKDHTFDKNREVTCPHHLRWDYISDVRETDMTHANEILKRVDKKDIDNRMLDNYNYRVMHHHVFDEQLIEIMCDVLEMDLVYLNFEKPFHLIAIIEKRKNVNKN